MTTTADTTGRRTADAAATGRRAADTAGAAGADSRRATDTEGADGHRHTDDGVASPLVHALRAATAAVGALLDRTGPRPHTMTVRAGDVAIDIAWPGAPSAAPAPPPAAAPPAPGTPEAGGAPQGPGGTPQAPDGGGRYVTAPTVGTFYRAPSPGGAPFVEEGGTVVAGQQVAIVEAMKLMIPVEAEVSGRIVRVCRQDGDPVEYGDPLFEVGPR